MGIDRALQAASIPTLIACLAQLSADERWLQPPFLPKRDRRLFHDETGGLPESAQAEVRGAAKALIEHVSGEPGLAGRMPDAATLARIMSVCVAESIPPEYVPMLMEDLGFTDRDVHWRSDVKPMSAARFRVLIIGAGASGLCAAIKLDRLGIPWSMVEKNADVGGVWYENDYPDAGVDTPNHFYCYSFAPNPRWSRYFSKRKEAWDYFRGVADRFGLRERIKFHTEAVALEWDVATQRWTATLRSKDGATTTEAVNAVIMAAGQMSRPRIPDIPGIESFRGPHFHSAHWRHEVPLEGKRVAVVGAGASAIQLVPEVARKAGELLIFQRSPQWVLPMPDYHSTVSPETVWLFENVPHYHKWYRFGLFWRFSDAVLRTLRRDPAWPYPSRAVNAQNDRTRQLMTEYLQAQLAGRDDLISKVLPDYPPYGKRILLDNRWFETLKRDNVELLRSGVRAVTPDGVIDSNGDAHEIDVLIFATGFDAGKFIGPLSIRGRSGRPLADVWAEDDPKAYLGITVPDYPNFFLMYGPNSNLGHGGSAIFQLECQARYITACLVAMIEQRIASMEVRREVHDEYNERVEAEHAQLVWTHPGTTNWFRNARGRVFSIMPWRMVDYWKMTHDPRLSEYVGVKV